MLIKIEKYIYNIDNTLINKSDDSQSQNKSDNSQSQNSSQNSALATGHYSSHNSAIEIPYEYIKVVANKSDDSNLHNSADNVKVPAARKLKKITKPSLFKNSSDTPIKPLRPIKKNCNTPSVKRYFSSVEKVIDPTNSSNIPSKKSRN